jgi:hypothetical protein
MSRLERRRQAHSRFNGELVGKLTGLQGKELGGLMRSVREFFGSQEALEEFVLSSSQEEVGALVLRVLSGRSN